jgi:putative acetyltransferase
MSAPEESATLLIRPEQPALHIAIYQVHRAAFGREAEANLVAALRQTPDFNPKFSLMALLNGQVVGHLLLTPVHLARPAEIDEPLLVGLAPLAVLPTYQRQLVGMALVFEALEVCRKNRVDAVFVLGDPAYYERFGFEKALGRGFTCALDPEGQHFQVCELTPPSLQGLQGEIRYHPLFNSLQAT